MENKVTEIPEDNTNVTSLVGRIAGLLDEVYGGDEE